jgi:hypothetical protein
MNTPEQPVGYVSPSVMLSRSTISHSARSLRDRTRQEDRHLKFYVKFYELRDNLSRPAPSDVPKRASIDISRFVWNESRRCQPHRTVPSRSTKR